MSVWYQFKLFTQHAFVDLLQHSVEIRPLTASSRC
jgi:hypothetical protein